MNEDDPGEGHMTLLDENERYSLWINLDHYRALAESGFEIQKYQGRMFLHNFICSFIIDQSRGLAEKNARLGASLPPALVSDWMFVLRKKKSQEFNGIKIYRRNRYERLRMFLNYKRHGLPVRNN